MYYVNTLGGARGLSKNADSKLFDIIIELKNDGLKLISKFIIVNHFVVHCSIITIDTVTSGDSDTLPVVAQKKWTKFGLK